jgi:hypothetical protein
VQKVGHEPSPLLNIFETQKQGQPLNLELSIKAKNVIESKRKYKETSTQRFSAVYGYDYSTLLGKKRYIKDNFDGNPWARREIVIWRQVTSWFHCYWTRS